MSVVSRGRGAVASPWIFVNGTIRCSPLEEAIAYFSDFLFVGPLEIFLPAPLVPGAETKLIFPCEITIINHS